MSTPVRSSRPRSTAGRLLQKFQAAPRALQWLILFMIGLAVFFGGLIPALDAANALNAKADRIAKGLSDEQNLLNNDTGEGKDLADGRKLFGEPLLPGDPANRPEAIHNAVDAILAKQGVSKRQTSERHVPFRGDELATLVGSAVSGNGERLILSVSFEASPETVTAVVSDLEQAKEVALVSKVELRRPDAGRDAKSGQPVSSGRVLKATIECEAWIVPPIESASSKAAAADAGASKSKPEDGAAKPADDKAGDKADKPSDKAVDKPDEKKADAPKPDDKKADDKKTGAPADAKKPDEKKPDDKKADAPADPRKSDEKKPEEKKPEDKPAADKDKPAGEKKDGGNK